MTRTPPRLEKIIGEVIDQLDAVKAELCRRHFYSFVQEFWPIIIEEKPVWNWHIEFCCDELQQLAFDMMELKKRKYDLIVNIPPGTTKSTIFTVMFPAWCWIARHPNRRGSDGRRLSGAFLRFITGSYADPLALEHADLSRDIIKSEKYRLMFPEIEIRRDKDAKSNFKNNKKGSRYSTSVGAGSTGKHAHFIIIDDPINPKEALSEPKRKGANNWMDHTLSTRKVDKALTVTILVMQRLAKLDPTGHLMAKKGKKIRHIVLPGTDDYEVKPARLKKMYKDGLLDPVRMDRDVLSDLRIDLGGYGYSGQIGQDPKPREGGMFQESWFRVVNAAPAGGTKWVRGWDLASTTEMEASDPAYTANARMKYCGGLFYISHAEHFRDSALGVKRRMKNRASQDGTRTVVDIPQDPGQAGKAQARDYADYMAGYELRFSPEVGAKDVRADPFSAQVEAGNVVLVDPDLKWSPEYVSEVCYFPNGHKDWVDASVRAFNRVVKLKKMIADDDMAGPQGTDNPHQMKPDG